MPRIVIGRAFVVVLSLCLGVPGCRSKRTSPPSPSASASASSDFVSVPKGADPCNLVVHWDGRTQMVCHITVIDDTLAQVLGARSDREELELFFRSTDSAALESVKKVPWVREVSIHPREETHARVDLRTLAPLTGLRELSVRNAKVREIEDAWVFRDLERISAFESGRVELAGTEKLGKLKSLSVGDAIADLGAVSRLTSLEHLALPGTQPDLRPLETLSNLSSLSVIVRPGTDPAPLAKLGALRELVIRGAPLDKLAAALSRLPKLTRLFLQDDRAVKSVKPLAGLERLELLDLSGTRVVDVTPLKALPKLKTLKLFDTPAKNLRVLLEFPALEQVLLPADTPHDVDSELRQKKPSWF